MAEHNVKARANANERMKNFFEEKLLKPSVSKSLIERKLTSERHKRRLATERIRKFKERMNKIIEELRVKELEVDEHDVNINTYETLLQNNDMNMDE